MGVEKTYTISELSEKTSIPVSTLQWLVAKGKLRAARTGLGGKSGEVRGIRVAESDYLQWWSERLKVQEELSEVGR